jgi:hypothetical protein
MLLHGPGKLNDYRKQRLFFKSLLTARFDKVRQVGTVEKSLKPTFLFQNRSRGIGSQPSIQAPLAVPLEAAG